MATYRSWSGSGVTHRANSTAYSLGARMQLLPTDTSTNYLVARMYVWECTTAGTSGAAVPAWSASYTPDSSTVTDGTVTWTCRNPGYSSGSTVDWTFASLLCVFTVPLLAAEDTLLVHYTSQEAATTVSQTLALPDKSIIISVDKDSSEAYAPMGTGGYVGNSSNSSNNLVVGPVANGCATVAGVTFRATNTSGSVGSQFVPGGTTDSYT